LFDHKEPSLSVVVCTYNRREYLKTCLSSILRSNYDGPFEVIVVDGGSTDGTRDLVEKEFGGRAKFVLQDGVGLSAARNTGVRFAKGSVIAFIDDDCVVSRGWARNLMRGYLQEDVVGVGGPARPYFLVHSTVRSLKRRFWRKSNPILGLYDAGDTTHEVRFLMGCNCSFKRGIFSELGFDVKTGRRRSILSSADDVDFCQTLVERGYKLLYVPDAVVYHKVPPFRESLAYLVRWSVNAGFSNYYVRRKHSDFKARNAVSKLVWSFRHIVMILLRRDLFELSLAIGSFIAFLAYVMRK